MIRGFGAFCFGLSSRVQGPKFCSWREVLVRLGRFAYIVSPDEHPGSALTTAQLDLRLHEAT